MFSPPHPVKKFYYRCDRKFHLDDLLKLYEVHDDYAIVLVSGKRTEFYLYNVNCTKFLKGMDESLPNQHKTGGQSAPRFGRIRDEKIGWYAKKIAEMMVQFYIKENVFKCKGLIIAGPAEMKDLVCEHELFIKHFSKYLLKSLKIAEITEQSIHQVVQMAADVLSNDLEEKELLNEFESMFTNTSKIDLLLFGTEEVLKAFHLGHLKEIYITDKSKHKELVMKSVTKTKIRVIRSPDFFSKYGELIGIRYFSSTEIVTDNSNEIVEI